MSSKIIEIKNCLDCPVVKCDGQDRDVPGIYRGCPLTDKPEPITVGEIDAFYGMKQGLTMQELADKINTHFGLEGKMTKIKTPFCELETEDGDWKINKPDPITPGFIYDLLKTPQDVNYYQKIADAINAHFLGEEK